MDDDSLTQREGKRGSRSSLVERAAERIAADTRKARERKVDPGPAAIPHHDKAETLPEVEPLDVSGQGPGQRSFADLSSERTAPVADVVGGQPTASEIGQTTKVRERSSQLVEIDFARIAERNIITPHTKRNRTLEEFRLIKRMVLSRRWDESDLPGNTIVVTSALPSEGKTTTAINLAMSIAAEEDLRVLLVDADFIKPDALPQLGVMAKKGLVDVLRNPSMDISDVMLRTNIEKLSLIPAGQLDDRCTELLASARMDNLITELAGRYKDRILIFDSPPLLVTTESVVLASHMGQVVFVVEAGRTKRESLMSALELIGDRPHLGLVLNRTTARLGNQDFGSYYGSYGYGYGTATATATATAVHRPLLRRTSGTHFVNSFRVDRKGFY